MEMLQSIQILEFYSEFWRIQGILTEVALDCGVGCIDLKQNCRDKQNCGRNGTKMVQIDE